MNEFRDASKGVHPDGRFVVFIGCDSRKSFNGVAVQGIEQADDIAVDFVLTTYDLAARLFTTPLEALNPFGHNSIPILLNVYCCASLRPRPVTA